MDRDHKWVAGMLGAWAVGSVDAEEDRCIRDHVAECEACNDDAVELRAAVEGVVDSGQLASPTVWERVLSTIHGRVGAEAERWLRDNAPITRIRVCLVDDDADVRDLWRAWLSRAGGFEVVGEAGDGDGAVAIALRERPDVLVLDLAMPGRSGLDALRTLGAASPTTRVVACSAYDELLTEAVFRGAVGGVPKLGSAEAFPESLRKLARA